MRASFAICCLFLLAGAVRADTAEEIIESFRSDITSCLEEAEIPQDQINKFVDNDLEGEERNKWGCVKACVLKRTNIMVDGQIHADNIKELMEKRFSKESGSSAEKVELIQKCVEEVAGKTDECEISFEFSRCMTPA